MVRQCICPHLGQDSLHGRGNRMMNDCMVSGTPSLRCTVCLKTYSYSGIVESKKAKALDKGKKK